MAVRWRSTTSPPRPGAWPWVGHDWPEEPPSGQREFPQCLDCAGSRAARKGHRGAGGAVSEGRVLAYRQK